MADFKYTNIIHSKPTQKVGFVVKTNGFKGEVKIALDSEEFEEQIADSSSLLLEIDGRWVPYKIENYNFEKSTIKLLDFNNENEAKAIVGLDIVLSKDEIENELEEDFVNFKIINQNDIEIGFVKNIINYSHNQLLEVDYQGKEILIPVHNDLIISLDHENRILKLNITEGLLDIF